MAENPFPVAPAAFTSVLKNGSRSGQVELRGFPMKFDMSIRDHGPGQVLMVSYKALDVNGTGPLQILRVFDLYGENAVPAIVHVLRRAILELLEHELDECLFVNGVRVHDPHEGGS